MNIGILTEISPEQRVALLPEAVKLLTENSIKSLSKKVQAFMLLPATKTTKLPELR